MDRSVQGRRRGTQTLSHLYMPRLATGLHVSSHVSSFCYQNCHEGLCPFLLTECPACKGRVRLGEKERHAEQECPERSLACRHCRAPCCRSDLEVR